MRLIFQKQRELIKRAKTNKRPLLRIDLFKQTGPCSLSLYVYVFKIQKSFWIIFFKPFFCLLFFKNLKIL